MKVIDLLNKIANGEEVPYRIKYNGRIYEYAEEIKWYLRDDMKCELSNSKKCLNDKVEIIEEENKIPEKLDLYDEGINILKQNEYVNARNSIHKSIISLECKYNQLIDYLKEKENK